MIEFAWWFFIWCVGFSCGCLACIAFDRALRAGDSQREWGPRDPGPPPKYEPIQMSDVSGLKIEDCYFSERKH